LATAYTLPPPPPNPFLSSRCTDPQLFTGFSPSLSPLAESFPADSTGRLDNLKRRLLQDPDWAAVSAARPLEIAFTSAHEAEHFGKRRRLTETDRKRLSATHGNQTILAVPKSRYWKDRDNPLDQIQIKITGQPHSQHPRNSQGIHTPPDRCANQGFTRSQSPDLLRSRLSANAQYGAHLRSDLSTSEIPPSTKSPIQRTRHITDEDKVLGERPDQGRQFSSSHQPQREPACSPTETLSASPTLIVTDSLSTTGTQSWLPHPTRRVLPSSPLLPRSKDVDLPTRAPYVPSHDQNSSGPFTRCAEDTSPAAPVKIFGQLVQMRSIDDAERL
jgi:hypothetical protein